MCPYFDCNALLLPVLYRVHDCVIRFYGRILSLHYAGGSVICSGSLPFCCWWNGSQEAPHRQQWASEPLPSQVSWQKGQGLRQRSVWAWAGNGCVSAATIHARSFPIQSRPENFSYLCQWVGAGLRRPIWDQAAYGEVSIDVLYLPFPGSLVGSQ